MKTKIIELQEIEKIKYRDVIQEAGNVIRSGGVVAFPTETVYGLGANALDAEASEKIYTAKGRPSDNPLIIHVAEKEAVYQVAKEVTKVAEKLMECFWPGPLTLVLSKMDIVPLGTTGGLDTVAVRMPDHELARDLIRAGGGYVAAPSANLSGRPSPTRGTHVASDMNGRIDMVVVEDNVEIGVESTILDLTVVPPMILRPGAITAQMLEECIGVVEVDRTILNHNAKEAPRAPGMKYRHYAPKASMAILEGDIESRISYIQNYVANETKQNIKIGIIATDETSLAYPRNQQYEIKTLGSGDKPEEIAANLYSVLRAFDDTQVEYIFSESFWGNTMSEAIMNRLNKAAGYNIIEVSN